MFPEAQQYKAKMEQICAGKGQIICLPEDCNEEDFRKNAMQVQAVIGDVPPQWLKGLQNIEWLQISWAGVGPYVQDDSLQTVKLTNASGAYGETIAEHVMGLTLALARRIPEYVKHSVKGIWKDCGSEWNLRDKKALILGVGDLGTHVAYLLKAFGMQVTGMCSRKREAEEPFSRLITEEELEEDLQTSDLVCGCLPETEKTAGLLNASRLSMTKKDSILINVGRGSLIDTNALTQLLQQNHFWGVGLDVTDPEPLPADHPLWKLKNVIITPHVAGIGFGHDTKTRDDIWQISLENLKRFCKDEPLVNLVNRQNGY